MLKAAMTEKGINAYQPASVSPPGATLADLLDERGIRQNELAVRMDLTPKFINELISGKVAISPHVALLLERTLDVPADFWLTRDALYQAYRARLTADAELDSQSDWLKELPLKEMIEFGWVRRCESLRAQIIECLKFFGVASPTAWREQYVKRVHGAAAWRISAQIKHAEGSIASWLRQGEIEALRIECKPFDRESLINELEQARAVTLEPDPEKFIPRLQSMFANCGVAVVFVRAAKGCPASGAVRWVAPDKAVVQLSLRYKTNDHLWFTFFHECAHLLLHGKKMLFLEGAKNLTGIDEDEANAFAAQRLIPQTAFTQFRALKPSRERILTFASQIGIAPGIVVGRMQKESLIAWSEFNDLKIRYAWRNSDE